MVADLGPLLPTRIHPTVPQGAMWQFLIAACLWVPLLIVTVICVATVGPHHPSHASQKEPGSDLGVHDWHFVADKTFHKQAMKDALVIYVFSMTDPQYIDNLHFFVREGLSNQDACQYIIVINAQSRELSVRS